MTTIRFRATLTTIGSHTILRLPRAASSKLPSRGLSLVEGTFNGRRFQTALEPDGQGSHWFRVSDAMLKSVRVAVNDSVSLEIVPITQWPEPKVPTDLTAALADDPKARSLWVDITPLARWDWIRWIGATRNADTRAIRIAKTFPSSNPESAQRAASTALNAPILRCHATAFFWNLTEYV